MRVTVRDEAGAEHVVAADYVIGCDGPRSAVREAIGSSYVGERRAAPELRHRLPRARPVASRAPRHALHYWIVNRVSPGADGPARSRRHVVGRRRRRRRETGEREAENLIDGAVGERVDAEVSRPTRGRRACSSSTGRASGGCSWPATRRISTRRSAATGSTPGIGDAVDLGWKLAAVLTAGAGGAARQLRGRAPPRRRARDRRGRGDNMRGCRPTAGRRPRRRHPSRRRRAAPRPRPRPGDQGPRSSTRSTSCSTSATSRPPAARACPMRGLRRAVALSTSSGRT